MSAVEEHALSIILEKIAEELFEIQELFLAFEERSKIEIHIDLPSSDFQNFDLAMQILKDLEVLVHLVSQRVPAGLMKEPLPLHELSLGRIRNKFSEKFDEFAPPDVSRIGSKVELF